jgi:hypothetical protein
MNEEQMIIKPKKENQDQEVQGVAIVRMNVDTVIECIVYPDIKTDKGDIKNLYYRSWNVSIPLMAHEYSRRLIQFTKKVVGK